MSCEKVSSTVFSVHQHKGEINETKTLDLILNKNAIPKCSISELIGTVKKGREQVIQFLNQSMCECPSYIKEPIKKLISKIEIIKDTVEINESVYNDDVDKWLEETSKIVNKSPIPVVFVIFIENKMIYICGKFIFENIN
jgi:hypothetical protein